MGLRAAMGRDEARERYGAIYGAVRCESKEMALAQYTIPYVWVVYGRLCALCSRGLRDAKPPWASLVPRCWLVAPRGGGWFC